MCVCVYECVVCVYVCVYACGCVGVFLSVMYVCLCL